MAQKKLTPADYGRKRWAGKSKAEKAKHGRMMSEARIALIALGKQAKNDVKTGA